VIGKKGLEEESFSFIYRKYPFLFLSRFDVSTNVLLQMMKNGKKLKAYHSDPAK
jgi:hypothetical protein